MDQPPPSQDKRICLGKIVAAHGVKGLVKIRPFGEDPSLLSGALYTAETGDDTLHVTLKNSLGKYILAEVKDVVDRTHAETIKGTDLYVGREMLPDLDEDGGYYFEDLAGLVVHDVNGAEIGAVISAENYGGGDLLNITLATQGEFLLPFGDDTVDGVDLDAKTITIKNYEPFIL